MGNFYQSNKSYEYIENGIHYLKNRESNKNKVLNTQDNVTIVNKMLIQKQEPL